MGVFDFIFKKKEVPVTAEDLLTNVEIIPGVVIPKALVAHWNEIEKTKLSYIAITAVPCEFAGIRQSSFGYYPCLPRGYAYPRDIDGKLMYPLAQIKCSELPVLGHFPKFGYLQFYISDNDVYGINFNDQQLQDHFKVLYFNDAEVQDFETDFSFLENTCKSDNVPIHKPHKLEFSIKEEYIGPGDVRSGEGTVFDMAKILEKYPSIEDELEEAIYDRFTTDGHKMGGYAHFKQSDPRCNDELLKYILLLQIDSGEEIMWGDCGVANFFIHPKDLQHKDFSKVMYNWDCS